MAKFKDFYLFRVDVTVPAQLDWIRGDDLDRGKILVDATLSVHDFHSRGRNWSLGNYDVSVENKNGMFCIGRSASFRKPSRDNELGNYNINIDMKNPFSRVLFDYKIGVICIEKNYDLAFDVERIAKMLQKILISTNVFVNSGLGLSIRAVRESEGLIEKIRSAHLIKKFSIHFTRRNPRNINRIFHQLPKIQLEAVGGEEGELTFKGGDMKKELLAEITQSARNASNNVVVSFIPEQGARSITQELNKAPITKFELVEDFEIKDGLLAMEVAYDE